jgi:hypothetical protein
VARSKARESSALVLGCDVVPSAIACALRTRGWDVVLIDDIDPPGPWRGMSFVNAWYFGSAELSSMAACFCASVKSIPAMLHRHNLITAGQIVVDLEPRGDPALCYGSEPEAARIAASVVRALQDAGALHSERLQPARV